MKKLYEAPEVMVITFHSEDVIQTSGLTVDKEEQSSGGKQWGPLF